MAMTTERRRAARSDRPPLVSDALVRAGLRMISSAAEDLEVLGEADDGAAPWTLWAGRGSPVG